MSFVDRLLFFGPLTDYGPIHFSDNFSCSDVITGGGGGGCRSQWRAWRFKWVFEFVAGDKYLLKHAFRKEKKQKQNSSGLLQARINPVFLYMYSLSLSVFRGV